MKLHKLILLLFLSITLTHCSSESAGPSKVTVQFDNFNLKKLDSTYWIQIDDITFHHKYKQPENSKEHYLPTFNYLALEVEGKKLVEQIDMISMATLLSKQLNALENYSVAQDGQFYTAGIMTINKHDGAAIKISTSENYPLLILSN